MHVMVQDDSSHWYIIPERELRHWNILRDMWEREVDMRVPDYAKAVDSPNAVRFNEYVTL